MDLTRPIDLPRAPLADVRAMDLRAPERDFWADEAALWTRLQDSWTSLDDAAWRLPGAAPSDAGGPDWSLLDHVAHIAAWQALAVGYTATALESGTWPTDDDHAGGDFDVFNERLRAEWAGFDPGEVRERLRSGRDLLLANAHRLGLDTIRTDNAWEWVYLALHGHYLDHLAIIEPWVDRLRSGHFGVVR
jgi:hypothetical protein